MERTLDIDRLSQALTARGLSQAALAERLGVSREAASKWLSGESFPRPDHLMRIALAVGLPYDQLVRELAVHEPVIAFRRKGGSKTTEAHVGRAQTTARLLERLVPHLPFERLVQHPTLIEPVVEDAYLQRVVSDVRSRIGLDGLRPVALENLIEHLHQFPVVIVPILAGERPEHEHALHVYLPKSCTTWIYLNLDSARSDFIFWVAHELGHVISPTLQGDDGERFADAFASALLFPRAKAAEAYAAVESVSHRVGLGGFVNLVKTLAEEYGISPITVYSEIAQYATVHGLRTLSLPKKDIFPAATNFKSMQPTVRELLFDGVEPSAEKFIEKTTRLFRTPFFDALRGYLAEGKSDAGYVQAVLNVPLLDARSIAVALT